MLGRGAGLMSYHGIIISSTSISDAYFPFENIFLNVVNKKSRCTHAERPFLMSQKCRKPQQSLVKVNKHPSHCVSLTKCNEKKSPRESVFDCVDLCVKNSHFCALSFKLSQQWRGVIIRQRAQVYWLIAREMHA
eukprot:GEMP01056811.1.p1 GENE.GEMP01056811.1~~GEMP01056811.1.p1  ORF type:complete len:134 (-),score=15.41 GEMP01056811.1:201-602(-)